MVPDQAIHLWPAPLGAVPQPVGGTIEGAQSAIPLARAPAVLSPGPAGSLLLAPSSSKPRDFVVVEPFFNQRKQLRLFAFFSDQVAPLVNGEPAPRLAVMSPGDSFQWATSIRVRVALFNNPRVGPPPELVLGKPCPVCRAAFAPTSITVSCQYGVVLHCDADEKEGLQCAQLRRECPVCKRPLALTEGYVNPPSDED